MVTYFISPYNPPQWTGTSELKIAPDVYSDILKRYWPDIIVSVGSSDGHNLLRWEIPSKGLEGQLMGENTEHGQMISFSGSGNDVIGFSIWHRSVVPQEYVLYFFSEGLGVKLKLEVSQHEIEASLRKILDIE